MLRLCFFLISDKTYLYNIFNIFHLENQIQFIFLFTFLIYCISFYYNISKGLIKKFFYSIFTYLFFVIAFEIATRYHKLFWIERIIVKSTITNETSFERCRNFEKIKIFGFGNDFVQFLNRYINRRKPKTDIIKLLFSLDFYKFDFQKIYIKKISCKTQK